MKYFNFIYIFNAFWRDTRNFIFMIAKQKYARGNISDNIIGSGALKIAVHSQGIKIFFNGDELTGGRGLSVGINTLGLWTDSSRADWQILERKSDVLKIKVIFKELPLRLIWDIKIIEDKRISWQIDIVTEEILFIDEIRITCSLSLCYAMWSDGRRRGKFSYPSNSGRQDIYFSDVFSSSVGVDVSSGDGPLPAFILELNGNKPNKLFPFVQNSPYDSNSHFIGFRKVSSRDRFNYAVGRYCLFSGVITFPEQGHLLDRAAENTDKSLKMDLMPEDIPEKRKKRNVKVLLANLPWEKDGKGGVRAGSRWPHLRDDTEEGYLPFPFFLAYAAALLMENGINASIIDAIASDIKEKDFIAVVLARGIDYLVVETSVPSFYYDLNILKKISKSGISIILCGPCSESYRQEFLRENSFIDFVLCGEYEYMLLELILSLQQDMEFSKVSGLIYRKEDKVIKNSLPSPFAIDTLPWPHRSTLPMERYIDNPGHIPYPSVQMLASRGCPFGCNFCLWPQVMYQGNHYRARRIKDVVDEMEFLVKVRKFKSVYFDDDTFNIGKERMLNFCREVKRRGLQSIPWAIMARADIMDEETLLHMKEAGLAAVKYGIESSSQKLINACEKNMDLKKAEKMILFTKSLDIKTHLTFTFGLPGETKSTIEKTIDYALKLKPYSVQFSIVTPFPGTKYFEELDTKGLILNKSWDCYDGNYKSVIKLDCLDGEDLEMGRVKAYSSWKSKVTAAEKS